MSALAAGNIGMGFQPMRGTAKMAVLRRDVGWLNAHFVGMIVIVAGMTIMAGEWQ